MKKQRRSHRPRLTRREFLAGSAAAGMALGLPGVLAGCGSDDDTAPPPPSGPREDRTLHFDLSFAKVSEARLCVLNSSDDGMMLEPHTAESRAHFRDGQI